MLKRLWAWIFERAPQTLAADLDTGAVTLTGMAGEASLLLAAYEGLEANARERSRAVELDEEDAVEDPIAAEEAALDAEERGRWMRDAHAWSVEALRRGRWRHDPYRAASVRDTDLLEAGERVRDGVRLDSAEEVARALEEYVTTCREASASMPHRGRDGSG